MLAVKTTDELKGVISELGGGPNARLYVPRWQFDSINVAALANVANLATRP
jgi:hypothetical protein